MPALAVRSCPRAPRGQPPSRLHLVAVALMTIQFALVSGGTGGHEKIWDTGRRLVPRVLGACPQSLSNVTRFSRQSPLSPSEQVLGEWYRYALNFDLHDKTAETTTSIKPLASTTYAARVELGKNATAIAEAQLCIYSAMPERRGFARETFTALLCRSPPVARLALTRAFWWGVLARVFGSCRTDWEQYAPARGPRRGSIQPCVHAAAHQTICVHACRAAGSCRGSHSAAK